MRYRTNEIDTGLYFLARLDVKFAGNRQRQLGDSCKPQISAPVSLANTFAEANEGLGRKSHPVIMKLQHHAIALIGLDPERICRAFHTDFLDFRAQIHDAALDRAPRGVGAESIDPNAYAVGFTLHDAAIAGLDFQNHAIDRAYDSQCHRWNVAMRVAKQEEKKQKHYGRYKHEPRIMEAHDVHRCRYSEQKRQQAFRCDQWISSSSQTSVLISRKWTDHPADRLWSQYAGHITGSFS